MYQNFYFCNYLKKINVCWTDKNNDSDDERLPTGWDDRKRNYIEVAKLSRPQNCSLRDCEIVSVFYPRITYSVDIVEY